ncbi:hypothetical protein BGZ75_006839 [Mortierella antarctica]|nr:hypothetical protein BGZ75_006839 [Mortierella antarctica]
MAHRTVLTNGQRLQLCIYSKNHPTLSHTMLGLWAKKEFQLKSRLAIHVVGSILRRAPELHAMDHNDLYMKQISKFRLSKMNLALGLWATQFGRQRGRAPLHYEFRDQSQAYNAATRTNARVPSRHEYATFLRRYGMTGPVASWNLRGSVRSILEKTGDRELSDDEILALAGIEKQAAAAESDINGENDLATDNEDDGIISDFDSDYSISKDVDNIGNNSEKRAGDETSQIASALPAIPSAPQPPRASGAPAPPEAPVALAAPTPPQSEVLTTHETSWSEKDVITILDDSDVDEDMAQNEDSAKNVEHGKSDELVLSTTATEGTTTQSSSGYRSLVVVLDLLDQYMATQELVHMVLEDMKEKKEQELGMNTTSHKTPPTSLSSGEEGSLQETLSSITKVMEDLDESQPMERATRLILRHMHYHLTCTASP